MKQILSRVRRACDDYNMISPGDTVCVGVSGGKDSMVLLTALARFALFSPIEFNVHAVSVDMGLGADFKTLADYCDYIGVPLTVVPTQIGRLIFDVRKEKNPCALCSKMKRGALHNAMLELGCCKIALGHHADDFAETFLLGLFYEGSLNGLKPVTFLDRKQITVIRPLMYCREKEIIYAANKNRIPIIKSNCPADGKTKREEMKELIKELDRKDPQISKRLITAVQQYTDTLAGKRE